MKYKVVSLIVISLLVLSGCIFNKDNNTEITDTAEEDFNSSGQAKAIEDETDLWQYLENEDAGFSLKYPHDIILDGNPDDLYVLTVEVAPIDSLDGTMGYNKGTAVKNVAFLKNNQYGEQVDFPLRSSKKIRDLDKYTAQEFTVLSRFEICSVTFEKKLYFFSAGNQVIVTLKGNEKTFKNDLSSYLTTNQENCSDAMIWDMDNKKMDEFYTDLEKGVLSEPVQRWHNAFDSIVKTIEFFDKGEISNLDALQGKWVSSDDFDSEVEFTGNVKKDYYATELMNQTEFDLYLEREATTSDSDGKYLILGQGDDQMEYSIVNISADYLELTYLPRGNTLKYIKISN
jgi:hypothetical protein